MNIMEKKRYNVVRKNQADIKALLRSAVAIYLFYLAFRLVPGNDSSFPSLARFLAGGLFIAAAVIFGWFTWRQYRAALKKAELTPEEEAALRRDQEP